jgi:hypothetical protein
MFAYIAGSPFVVQKVHGGSPARISQSVFEPAVITFDQVVGVLLDVMPRRRNTPRGSSPSICYLR